MWPTVERCGAYMYLCDEAGRGARASVTHRQVDDEVEAVLHQVVSDRELLHTALPVPSVFIRPIYRLHLQHDKKYTVTQVWTAVLCVVQMTTCPGKLSQGT